MGGGHGGGVVFFLFLLFSFFSFLFIQFFFLFAGLAFCSFPVLSFVESDDTKLPGPRPPGRPPGPPGDEPRGGRMETQGEFCLFLWLE